MAHHRWGILPATLAATALLVTACYGSPPDQISGAPPDNRTVAETLLGTVDTANWIAGTFNTDATRSHFAYVGLQGEQRVAIVDGNVGPPYTRMGTPHFSLDGTRVAYAVELPDKTVALVVDGVQGKSYSAILPTDTVFSPDGGHVAYAVKQGATAFMVIDGAESVPYDDVGFIVWSKDGARSAYASVDNGVRRVVLDGAEQAAYARVPDESQRFSDDGRHFAYAAQQADLQWVVVLDGVESDGYEALGRGSPVFDATGRMAHWYMQSEDAWFVSIGDQRLGPYERVGPLVFTDDGRHFAFAALVDETWRVIRDGTPGTAYPFIEDTIVIASPTGDHVAYVVRDGTRSFLVLDGKEHPRFDSIGLGTVTFSPDGSRLAYAGLWDGAWRVVVDGVTGTEAYHDLADAGISFSPDSKHVAIVAGVLTPPGAKRAAQTPTPDPPAEAAPPRSDIWYTVADGQRSKPYGDIVGSAEMSPVVFDAAGRLHYIAIRSTNVYRVDEAFIGE